MLSTSQQGGTRESLGCPNQKSLFQRIFSLICHLKEKVKEMVQNNPISECPKEPFERCNASLNVEILCLFFENNEMVNDSSLRIYFIHMKEITASVHCS